MNARMSWRSSLSESCRLTPLRNLSIATVLISLFFIYVPSADIEFSRLFFTVGSGFSARQVSALQTLRAIGQYCPVAFAIIILLSVIMKLLYPWRKCLFPPRFTVYFASLFLLGPSLLVNGVLKPFWDRPRPVNTLEFGGKYEFLDAWAMGGAVFANRSFVSGETAGVICLLPLAMFVRPEWRKTVLILLSVFAIVVSMNRIAFGAHYMSDVLISAGLTGIIAVALWHVVYGPNSAYSDVVIEKRLSRGGFYLRRRFARLVASVSAIRFRPAPAQAVT